jgi:malate/lactate dehydrogenase
MGVTTDGSYGVPKGLIYSFPVICHRGSYKIAQGLKVDPFSQKYLDATTKELQEEKAAAEI